VTAGKGGKDVNATGGPGMTGQQLSGSAGPVRRDQLRLMAKVARLYHEHGMRQVQIAEKLHISQSRVSRLLRAAVDAGVIRTIVALPGGVHTQVEEALEERYGLTEAVVTDCPDTDVSLTLALGAAGAGFLEAALLGGDVIGISSWSATLLALAEALPDMRSQVADDVVQLVGGVGASSVQVQANRLLARMAQVTGGSPEFVPSVGIVGSLGAVDSVMSDPSMLRIRAAWRRLTVALVGIGSIDPSPLAMQSGNAFPEADREELRALGAVGDICFRFFDADGQVVASEFNDRIVGISSEELKAVPRRVGIAGGEGKYPAILAAVRGGWVNVLVTDVVTATRLAEAAEPEG
jgi:DNA-binding transcriptional regulator LsrR (DeoR family)